jgi:acyl carrier protein
MYMRSIAEVTERIARLFEEELGAKDVGPDTHFIFSGGDSLNAESLVVAINEEYGLSLKTATLLDAPTPHELALVVISIIQQKAPA